MDEEYKPSVPRVLAARAHDSLERQGPRFERFTDWLAVIAGSFVLLIVLSMVGFVWLPVTGTIADLLIWFAAPIAVTLAVVAATRALRRRRHGSKPSTAARGAFGALVLASSAWFGLMMLGALVAALADGDAISAGFGFFVLVGAAALVGSGVQLYRYVMRE